MADVNVVVLVGNLTRDAELKYLNSGIAVCEFSLAINSRRKSGDQWIDEAHFFDITFFGKGAEAVHRYLVKGKQVAVNGELRQDRWEQDGQKRSKVKIVANNVQLLGGGQRDGSGYEGGESRPYASQGQGPAQNQGQGGYREERPAQARQGQAPRQAPPQDDFPDDIPF
ncbi:MAG TPA: single-stranded DNA-binding protein [Spirochaetales bacterium]|nr:single-stranded DNA-binding protein [Spirochaetales bacterium]